MACNMADDLRFLFLINKQKNEKDIMYLRVNLFVFYYFFFFYQKNIYKKPSNRVLKMSWKGENLIIPARFCEKFYVFRLLNQYIYDFN